MEKLCTKCGVRRDSCEFFVDRNSSSGLFWRCKPCSKIYERDRVLNQGGPKRKGRKPRPCPDGTRWCGACRSNLSLDRFGGNERTCRECKRYKAFWRTYGLTREKYDKLLELQCGYCAICCDREAKYVDHDHKTGEVRGILCQPCNTAIGMMREDVRLFLSAMNYLENPIARSDQC